MHDIGIDDRKTEIMGISVGAKCGVHLGKPFELPNESGFYHGLLIEWLDRCFNGGELLLVGESNGVKEFFSNRYYDTNVKTLNIEGDCDICADITVDLGVYKKWDCIVSQAMLEHVWAPGKAVSNMRHMLKPSGLLILHTVGPAFPEHKHPVDCCRFFPDFFEEAAKCEGMVIEDCIYTSGHCAVMYRVL